MKKNEDYKDIIEMSLSQEEIDKILGDNENILIAAPPKYSEYAPGGGMCKQ